MHPSYWKPFSKHLTRNCLIHNLKVHCTWALDLTIKAAWTGFNPPLFSVELKMDINDLEMPLEQLSEVKVLGDLGTRFKVNDIAKLPVHPIDLRNPYLVTLNIRIPEKDRIQALAKALPKELVKSIALDPELQGE